MKKQLAKFLTAAKVTASRIISRGKNAADKQKAQRKQTDQRLKRDRQTAQGAERK